MNWAALIFAGLMECVWATALDRSEGFTHVVPIIVFVVGMALSVIGLGYALKTLPVGMAYAIWTGIGAASTVIVSIATGHETFSVVKVLLIAGLIGCIIGLRVVSEG